MDGNSLRCWKSMGKSSKDKRDIYYRKAKEDGWRARSAFKLLQVDEEFHVLDGVKNAVDLCAAPGSWSQVLQRQVYAKNPESRIVAVDLQEMAPLEGVIQLQGDITDVSTAEKIIGYFDGEKADLVICDGAPDVTGMHDIDEYLQSQLVLAALNITSHVLREGGAFVAKIFRGRDIHLLYSQLRLFFERVTCSKPKSSRNTSIEAFVVCQGFHVPENYQPTMINPMSLEDNYGCGELHGAQQWIVPFLAVGDLRGFDSDQNYMPGTEEESCEGSSKSTSLDPVQPPTNPPYKKAIEMRRQNRLQV